MWTSTFLFLLYFSTVTYVLSDGTYECGQHGKFEYCIDEIPGCVIGCHCHPGYYFDTDTKICEPNSKLIEHHRRHYVGGPTRIQNFAATPNSMFETDLAATTSRIDGKVHEINKDANDLGDWLYNQFFKTIENQVINNTSDTNILTRRSGSGKSIRKPKRRKKWGSKGKLREKEKPKEKRKKGNLKKKLLRITEDDSIFDLNSGSNSDSNSDSSDSSSSDSSVEYDRRDAHHDNDDEHGHKKIVMINKKPKPPLPSFIFLPNMDTPFYPPIGLPPPPIVPMYPIVPVPPVVPFCVTADCVNEDGKTTSTTTTTSTGTTVAQIIQTSTVKNSDKPKLTETPVEPSTDKPLALRLTGRKRKKEPKTIENDENINDFGLSNLKPSSRQKFLKLLKERMGNPSGKFVMSPWKKNKQKFMDAFIKDRDKEGSQFENDFLDDSYLRNNVQGRIGIEEAPPENVDFKYITELIHKVDLKNKSNDLPPIEYNPLDSIEMYQPSFQQNQYSDYILPPNAPDGRRYNRPNKQQSDDSYYMKLGREIASMIRGIDVQNREVSLKLEGSHDIPKNDIYFNANSPRSYWERSVRSPLTFLKSNKSKLEYLKRSNELLFDIENKVEIVASTRPTLTLQEIENIVNVMEMAKKEIQKKESSNKSILPQVNSLNINLWPQEVRDTNIVARNSISNISSDNRLTSMKNSEPNKNNKMKQISVIPADTHGIRMHDIHRFVAWRKSSVNNAMNSNDKMTDVTFTIQSDDKLHFGNSSINLKKWPSYDLRNDKQIKHVPLPKHNLRQSLLESNMDSLFLKHRKYFDNNHNYFTNKQGFTPKSTQPSYFRQEINHFEYINEN